jgi:protein-disulfide isomerase
MERYKMIKTVLLSTLVLLLISCQEQPIPKVRSLSQAGSGSCSSDLAAPSDGAPSPLFSLDGKNFYATDLSQQAQDAIYSVNQQTYIKVKAIAEEHALRVVLAKKRGKLKADAPLPPLKELIELPKVSDKKIKKFYEENKHRLPPGANYQKMKGQIQQYLQGQSAGEVFKQEVAKMKKSAGFKLRLVQPISPKMTLNTDGHPSLGDSNSKVKVIEVSDYLCPHCQHAHHEVADIIKKYGDKIQLTQINFSLRPNGLSGTFVRGALCVQKMAASKFWEYHNLAFTTAEKKPETEKERTLHMAMLQDGNSKEAIAYVGQLGAQLKLDVKKFTACLKDKKISDRVKEIGEELSQSGVSGTPLFIVNNTKLPGGSHDLEEAIKQALRAL